MAMFADFQQHLHRGGAFAYYHVLPQKRSIWYEVGDDPEPEPAKARTNLYFSVHPSRIIPPCNASGEVRPSEYVRSQLRTIAAINCLFAEYDIKDYGSLEAIEEHISNLPVPEPSCTVLSGGGLHVYWLLKEPYTTDTEDRLKAAQFLQSRWVELVGGDRGANDLTRILRVPGSRNYKYEPPRWVEWRRCDLSRQFDVVLLGSCLPPIVTPAPKIPQPKDGSIAAFNEANDIGAVLERYGYKWHGRRKMLSPWSSTGQAGVTVDTETNRAYIHHGSDPLHDGYWKRPFDIICILDYHGDFRRALAAVREALV